MVNSVYDHFDQINLTDYSYGDNYIPTMEECHTMGVEISGKSGYKSRSRKEGVPDYLIEDNYNTPTELYIGSYFEDIVNSFEAEAIRVRLTRLRAGTSVDPHIDYDPSYAVRIILPIVTNDNVINHFWKRNEKHSFNIPANGVPYFLNTGFKHSVDNNSDKDRIALMFSLKTQEDIKDIKL